VEAGSEVEASNEFKSDVTMGGSDDGRSLDTRGETGRFTRARLASFAFGLMAKTTSGDTSTPAVSSRGEAGGVGRLVFISKPLGDPFLLSIPTFVLVVEIDDAVGGGVYENTSRWDGECLGVGSGRGTCEGGSENVNDEYIEAEKDAPTIVDRSGRSKLKLGGSLKSCLWKSSWT